jgi:rubrerythrin/Icc-related predicted phosphoesterase
MLQKPIGNIEIKGKIEKFIVCGDSGCDGYNTEGIAVFEEILRNKADFTVIAGDIVSIGSQANFNFFEKTVNKTTNNPVYVIPGNHDINLYEEFCGKKNYCIITDDEMFIFLDNSKRYFSEETINILRDGIDKAGDRDIFIFFHIPPKNPYLPNNIADEEWNKIRKEIDIKKSQIKKIFCGHIHAAVEYMLDGYEIIITGGAGSKFDGYENSVTGKNDYHFYSAEKRSGEWEIKIVEVPYHKTKADYTTKEEQEVLLNLEKAFLNEAVAYRKYQLYAEIAESEGYSGIAKLFRAASESEYYHAKNMLISMNGIESTMKNLEKAIENEQYESEEMYMKFAKTAENTSSNRAYNSFLSALEAEKVHYKLLKEAYESLKNGNDIKIGEYHTCTRCGYTHKGEQVPRYCPGCGTDMFKFSDVK